MRRIVLAALLLSTLPATGVELHGIVTEVQDGDSVTLLLRDDLSPEHLLVPRCRRVVVPGDQMDMIENEHFAYGPTPFHSGR